MKHPTAVALSHYAAGAGDLLVQTHLENEGCTFCVTAVTRMREIIRGDLQEETAIPPGWLHPYEEESGVPYVMPGQHHLHLRCDAGLVVLDFVVCTIDEESRIALLGRVTGCPRTKLPLQIVEARLRHPAIWTRTDGFGDFEVELPREGVFGLRLGDAPAAPYVLVWDPMLAAQMAG